VVFDRKITERIRKLAEQFPALVLTGGRQSGKTTLLRRVFNAHRYVSLDLPSLAEKAEREPDEFLREYSGPLLLDEIQYAPNLFRHLKRVIDADRHAMGRFILTGSQKFTLMREVSDSLAGRCAWLELEPLSLEELRKGAAPDDNLIATMVRGLFPELWRSPETSSTDFYSTYLATYLERDVRQLLNVVSLRDFERFLRIVAARSGQLLNKADVAKDVGVSVKAIGDWISVLSASNQIIALEPYFQNIAKRAVKSPKIYFCDTGLLCFLLNLDETSLARSSYLGSVWETLLFAEMRKGIAATGERAHIWFYRDQRAREIDFVVESGGELTFVEAKWTEHPVPADARSILTVDEELRSSKLREQPGHHAVLCRSATSFPVAHNVRALPYAQLARLWQSRS
jgi:uncharacterized protein